VRKSPAAARRGSIRRGRAAGGVYRGDPHEGGHGSRFKWLVSTCIAAAVGVGTIGAVILGSLDGEEMTADRKSRKSAWEMVWELHKLPPALQITKREPKDVQAAAGKSDRLQVAAGGLVTRHDIHDSTRRRIGGRERIEIKHYARVVGRLATAPPQIARQIPPFNPFRLYADGDATSDDRDDAQARGDSDVAVKVVELLGGFLPEEDGQELDGEEVAGLVVRTREALLEPAEMRQAFGPEGAEAQKPASGQSTRPAAVASGEPLPANTTVLAKSSQDSEDEEEDTEGQETRRLKLAPGESLMTLLRKLGAEVWQARAIFDIANGAFPLAQLGPSHEVRVTLVPSPTNAKRLVPKRVAIYEGASHKVTVARNAAGEFTLDGAAMDSELASGRDTEPQHVTLYGSLYHAALMPRLPPEMIELILKVNAYDVDFKRRARPGDGFELFFDLKDVDRSGEGTPGELLFTAMTTQGETRKFYRFRTPDGMVDYYDEQGQNSKKFLMRKPIRSLEARLADGFGMRIHPLFRVQKMHTGLDWAAPQGTPILAAGAGVIEAAGRNGGYGNYVRIRHANGYKTTYGHMVRIAPGLAPEVRVRQGQVIGFVGSTGHSTGPHLHYEILVNNQFINPLRIADLRDRSLAGKELAEFQKERARIEELMRRGPVSTRVFTDTPNAKQRADGSLLTTSSVVGGAGK
jgi:hypothetical protein